MIIIVNKIFYLKSNSPSGSDLTALDCYILVSLLCVIGTLVEFALVLLVRQSSELFKSSKRQHENDITKHANMVKEYPNTLEASNKVECFIKNNEASTEAEKGRNHDDEFLKSSSSSFEILPVTTKIDFIAFFISNFIFITFNVVYFLWF